MNRKLRKLIRNPKLFFKDMYFKHKTKLGYYQPQKNECNNQFTIVSAVYNVEKYLNDFFKSIKKQNIDFKKYVHIICVDDGSTDTSARIIKKWQRKYPNNITYLYKENGGQASARNLGISHVKTDWVTFIDPDDFVSANYFHNVDKAISTNKDLSLISCPFIFYIENEKKYKDSHPLRYRFKEENYITAIQDMNDHIQLSVNSAFFKIDILKRKNIQFSLIKPNFEDAKFVGDYLTAAHQSSRIAFITGCNYFYRKRSDGTSTLDGAWKNPLLYTQVLSDGCIALLENSYKTLGYIPKHIQFTVLYHLSWYFKYLINNNKPLNILDDEKKSLFKHLLHEIFKYIDNDTIMEFNLAGTWFYHRVAWLGYFKNKHPDFQIVYIEKLDRKKKQFLASYFVKDLNTPEEIIIDKKRVTPLHSKFTKHELANSPFVYERRLWLPYNESTPKAMIHFKINGQEARISLAGKHHINGIPTYCLSRDFPLNKYKETNDSWILMDRDTQADDNAEHLYRFIKENHPNQKIYFALSKKSHDWNRLEEEDFNLIEFGSSTFENILVKASKIISSHADEYIVNYFGDHFEFNKQFIFLQHGVIHNDLSSWINSKKNLACLITTTPAEYQAIAGNLSKYKATEKEVVLTGLPRHDSLLKGNKTSEKIILIMPTWRNNILGTAIPGSNRRKHNSGFMNTEYAIHWHSVLHNSKLKEIADKYGYQIIFAPHANIEPYLNQFDIPKYISTWKASDSSIQTLFQRATCMITDYSSVAFEMGVLSKQVFYYQFDKDYFFNEGHVFQQGYYDYEKDGFGPVVYDENNLILELDKLLKNNGVPISPYAERIKDTFPLKDGKSCQRVYDAIINLDKI